jgi:hypothetical protein
MIFKMSAARQTVQRKRVLGKPRWRLVLEKLDFVDAICAGTVVVHSR